MIAPAVTRSLRADTVPASASAGEQAIRRGLHTTQFMSLGEGTWAPSDPAVAVAATVEASFTRTRVDVKLFPTAPHQRQAAFAPPTLAPADADALAAQPWYPDDMWQRELDTGGTADAHAPLEAQLAPGDFVLAMALAGAVLELTGPTETITIALPHPAWVLISHPKAAALRAAAAGVHGHASLTIRQVFGTWIHCRRSAPAPRTQPDDVPPGDGMEVDPPAATEDAVHAAGAPHRPCPAPTTRSAATPLRPDSWAHVMDRVARRCDSSAPPAGTTATGATILVAASWEAASAALTDMHCSLTAAGDFAAWLRGHVTAALAWRDGPPQAWQWNLTCATWAVHAAGADHPAEEQQALRALG